MVYRGYVRNGKIEIDDGAPLPEGAEVDITVRSEPGLAPKDRALPTLFEQLADIIGTVPDLPEDLSVNHDHYLYGTSRRE